MKTYQLSYRKYDQETIRLLQSYRLRLGISQLTGNLICNVSEKDKEWINKDLSARGYTPTWNEVFENVAE